MSPRSKKAPADSLYHYKTPYQRETERFNAEVTHNSKKIEKADQKPRAEIKKPIKKPTLLTESL